MTDDRVDLKNLSPDELAAFLEKLGEKPFRAGQVRKWLFKFGVRDFEEMTDLSRDLRARLADQAEISRLECEHVAESSDGSRKLLWRLRDGQAVESVLIPERDHYTLCLSSQVGCAMGCRFCRTARIGFQRDLTTSEIVNQFLQAREHLPPEAGLTNLVFMGMGEPLANLENVSRAIESLTLPGLTGLSRKHLSVSTVGLVPALPALAQTAHVGLTVSLNAPEDAIRDRLMPINRRHPMAELHAALAAWPLPRGRRITIAYVLLAGVNDSERNARDLARYLHGLKVKVNLIPFNPFPGAEFDPPDEAAIETFRDILVGKHFTVIVRRSKGRDVAAACGQLAGERSPQGTGL